MSLKTITFGKDPIGWKWVNMLGYGNILLWLGQLSALTWALFLLPFRHIFLAPSPILMILLLDLWYFSLHFLEKSHFAKVLNINDIILYLGRRMILWDFFREKTFLRAHVELSFVLQFSAERNIFFIKTSYYFIFLLYLCLGYRSKISMVPKTLWVKTKAFAIISRLAKSVGNSIWNNKHGNNMW